MGSLWQKTMRAIHTSLPSPCDRQSTDDPNRQRTSPAFSVRYSSSIHTHTLSVKPSQDMRSSIACLCLAMLLSPATAAVVQRSSNTGRSPDAQPGAVLARQDPVPSASPIGASIPANGTITSSVTPEIPPVTSSISPEITPVAVLAVAKPDCTPKSICVDKMNYACMKRYGA